MERTTIEQAKQIFGSDFIGIDELRKLSSLIGIFIPDNAERELPEIQFDIAYLNKFKDDYILILGIPFYKDQSCLTLSKLRDHFGWNPEEFQPCFYNQDWYLKEEFANICTIQSKWYLLRKSLFDSTRGLNIENQNSISSAAIPSALLCVYAFFSYYYLTSQYLWETDFVWCNDLDSNSDRIYVGRYTDKSGKSKNGFSIHRHLKLTKIYGIIDSY